MASPYGKHPGYGRPQPQRPSSGSNVGKTCLIVFTVVSICSLAILGICAGFFFLIIGNYEDEDQIMTDRDGPPRSSSSSSVASGGSRNRSSQAAAVLKVSPPSDLNQALVYLNKDEPQYHVEAGKWLTTYPLDRNFQERISKALTNVLRESSRDGRKAAIDALATWGDISAAGAVANALSPGNSFNKDLLNLLSRWKDTIGCAEVAKLLESDRDANDAYLTLKAIGPDSAPYVAEYLRKSGKARDYARRLIDEWGIDPDEAAIVLYLDRIEHGDRLERNEAAQKLALIPPVESERSKVLQVLHRVLDVEDSLNNDLMKALTQWGDESSLPTAHRVMQGRSVGRVEAIRLVAKLQAESSLPILAEMLGDRGDVGTRAAAAMVEYGEAAKGPALSKFNDSDETTRQAARSIARQLDVDDEMILEQCMKDLRSPESRTSEAAFNYVSTVDRGSFAGDTEEIADAIVTGFKKLNVFQKRDQIDVVLRWVDERNLQMLIDLTEDYDETVWTSAFAKMLTFENKREVAPPTADLLSNRLKREKALKIMYETGPDIEELAILMLDHNDEDALVEMCKLLAEYGSEKCLANLSRLSEAAKRAKAIEVRQAADRAGSLIKRRLAREKNLTDGDGAGDDGSEGGS